MQSTYIKAYEKTDVLTTDPQKLILMLYDGALKNLYQAKEGIRVNNPRVRGEHLGKAIAIISELLSVVEGDGEVPAFLRGLYTAILAELPRVNITNDEMTLDVAIKYVTQLRHIWQTEVMPFVQAQKIEADRDRMDKAAVTENAGRPLLAGGHQSPAGVAAYACSFSTRG